MKRWMRRVRGAIGTGMTWAFAWFGAGMAMLVTSLLLTGSTGADVPYPIGFGAIGFVAGVAFSGVLSLTEGRRRFDQMSLGRFAGWGAAGGCLLAAALAGTITALEGAVFLDNFLVLGTVFGIAGAASAGGSLLLARRAEEGLLAEADDELSNVGLTLRGGP